MPAYIYSNISFPTADVGKFYLVLGAEYTPATGTANNFTSSAYLQLDVSSGTSAGLGDASGNGGKLAYDSDDAAIASGSPAVVAGTILNKIPSSDIFEVSIRRGRTRDDQGIDVGEMTVVLNNVSGNYDPDNLTTGAYRKRVSVSPDKTLSWLAPGTFGCLMYGESSTTSHCIFAGIIESVEADQSRYPRSTITFVDNVARLGRDLYSYATVSNIPLYCPTDQTTANRTASVFKYIRWQGAEYNTLKAGTRTHSAKVLDSTPLSFIEECVSAEGGRVFCDRTGVIRVLSHKALKYVDPAAATLVARSASLTLNDLGTAIGYDSITTVPMHNQIMNKSVVIPEAGKPVTYTDPESSTRYGLFSVQASSTLSKGSDNSDYANYLATRRSLPSTAVAEVSLPVKGLSATNKVLVVKTDLGDLISVSRLTKDGRTLSSICWVEGITWDINPTSWRVTYQTSAVDSTTY